ncbi:transposase family protein [Saccharopolyspora shandongensis]|uniref:transposase family protein n=1 Tax=Saccharopolyspora shandongensis TaxID=418495 RepID=UPI0033C7371E
MLVWARVEAEDGVCPSCGGRSRRVHSRYHRGLADVSVAGQPVTLRLQVRRFFCDDLDCPIRTFAEQVDGLTAKHARRTSPSRAALEPGGQGGGASGGSAGDGGRPEHPAAAGACAARTRGRDGRGARCR